MKVKNIMFSGFMAAIMMSATAGVANAAVSVASKGYVDSKTVNASYATDSTNYLGSVTGVKNATVELDKQIKSVSDVANAAVKSSDFESFQTTNTTAIADAKAAGTAASDALDAYKTANDAAVKANTDALAVLNGDKTVNGSVDFKIEELNTRLSTESGNAAALAERVNGLEGEIDANTAGLAKLNGDASTEGSVAKSIADAVSGLENGSIKTNADNITSLQSTVSTLETKTDANAKLTEAKGYTDTKVGEVNTALADYAKTTDVISEIATATANMATKGTTLAHYGITDASTTEQMNEAIATAKSGAEATAKGYTDDEIAKLSAIARATVPAECESTDSSLCVLTLGTNGEYKWVSLTEPVNDDGTNGTL